MRPSCHPTQHECCKDEHSPFMLYTCSLVIFSNDLILVNLTDILGTKDNVLDLLL